MFRRFIPSPLVSVSFAPDVLAAQRIKNGKVIREFYTVALIAVRKGRMGRYETVAVGEKARAYAGQEAQGIWVCQPFAHDRLIFHDFPVAELLLGHALREVCGRFSLRPQVVLQPMRKKSSPLTDIERRALTDSTFHAGAGAVWIHLGGEPLKPEEVEALSFSESNLSFVGDAPESRL